MLNTLRRNRQRARERAWDAWRAVDFRLHRSAALQFAARLDAAATDGQRFDLVQQHLPGGSHQRRGEIVPFLETVAALRPRRILEIGTGDGGTTILLGRVANSVESLAGADLLVKNKPRIRRLVPPAQNVVLINGSSASASTYSRVVRVLDGASLDLLFIDGDHSYYGCLWDLRNIWGKMLSGGLIYVHDYWTIDSLDPVALCVHAFVEEVGSSKAQLSRVGTTTFARILVATNNV